jgi:hypothetical protein
MNFNPTPVAELPQLISVEGFFDLIRGITLEISAQEALDRLRQFNCQEMTADSSGLAAQSMDARRKLLEKHNEQDDEWEYWTSVLPRENIETELASYVASWPKNVEFLAIEGRVLGLSVDHSTDSDIGFGYAATVPYQELDDGFTVFARVKQSLLEETNEILV